MESNQHQAHPGEVFGKPYHGVRYIPDRHLAFQLLGQKSVSGKVCQLIKEYRRNPGRAS